VIHRLSPCFILVVLSAILAVTLTDAQPVSLSSERPTYGRWTSSALGGGGFVMGVHFTEADPDRLWAHTDVGGVYRSDDGGNSWRNATYTLPYGLDPAERSDAAPLGDRGLMYVRDMVGDPDEPDRAIILVGYKWSPDYGLYLTEDGGATWRNVQEMWSVGDPLHREYGRALVRSESHPETLYAASRGQGVFRSDDDGATWRSVGGPKIKPTDLDIHPSDPDKVWLTAVAFDETVRGMGRLAGGLWKSEDGGATWKQHSKRDTFEIMQDPADPGVLWGIFENGYKIERSADGGVSWTPMMEGLMAAPSGADSLNPENWRYQGLAVAGGSVMATSAKGDVYRLAGKRWQRVGPQTVHEPEDWHSYTAADHAEWAPWVNTMNSATGLYPHPADPENTWWITDWYSVYQTTDGGKTWNNQTNGIEETYVHTVVPDAADPARVHLGVADIGYFRSKDAGDRFIRPKREPITNNVASITTTPAQPGRVYAVGPNPPVGGWYAGRVFISDDHGDTWRTSPMNGLPEISEGGYHANDIAACTVEKDTVYLGVGGDLSKQAGLYVSRDGGESWQRDTAGFPTEGEFFVHEIWESGPMIALAQDGTQLIVSPKRRMMLRRDAAGEEWQRAKYPTDGELVHLAADPHRPGRFYGAVKYAGIFRTDDHGQNWSRLDLPDSTPGAAHLILDPHQSDRIAAGTPRGVILSSDAGDTWEVLDRSLPGRVDWNSGAFVLTPDGTTRLIVGSGGTGVFWTEVE